MNTNMMKNEKEQIAAYLYHAEKTRQPISKISNQFPDMTIDDAYEIQKIGIDLRKKDGAKIIGKKIGITSKGMQRQLNVNVPDYGQLLDSMMILEGKPCIISELISPRVEGELAFVLNKTLKGPGVKVTDVYNSTEWIFPCFEVCDTRIVNWDVTVFDTISDNAGASRFVLGSTPKRISEINLRLIGMLVEKNGAMIDSGVGAEVMGNPAAAVAWLANKLSEYDIALESGEIILSGAFMSALPAIKGDVFTVSVDGFPSVNLRFE